MAGFAIELAAVPGDFIFQGAGIPGSFNAQSQPDQQAGLPPDVRESLVSLFSSTRGTMPLTTGRVPQGTGLPQWQQDVNNVVVFAGALVGGYALGTLGVAAFAAVPGIAAGIGAGVAVVAAGSAVGANIAMTLPESQEDAFLQGGGIGLAAGLSVEGFRYLNQRTTVPFYYQGVGQTINTTPTGFNLLRLFISPLWPW